MCISVGKDGSIIEKLKKTESEYYPPVENLLDLIFEPYKENNPVEKNTVAGKTAKAKGKGCIIMATLIPQFRWLDIPFFLIPQASLKHPLSGMMVQRYSQYANDAEACQEWHWLSPDRQISHSILKGSCS